jgi:integrase
MMEAADVNRLLDTAAPQLKAMILLAVNCGFGNSDCGTLPMSSLDLDGGWLNYHRPKTGIDRRCPLWSETAEALKAVLANRREPTDNTAKGSVFVTKYGGSWAGTPIHNPVSKEFRKLLDELGLHKPGLGFYTLRHVFRTVADEARDQPAANAIMGHADESMAAVYRERIGDDRLRAVSEHVRRWLFKPKPDKADQPTGSKSAKPKREGTKRSSAVKPAVKSRPKRQSFNAPVAAGPLLRIVG